MRIIAKKTLRVFWEKHPDSENPLKIWYKNVEEAQWKNFAELRQDYGSADAVGNERIIFDIKGNKYRLVAKVDFDFRLVFIRFIGTHTDYNKMNKKVGADKT
jgi:mRNA interferase HigB